MTLATTPSTRPSSSTMTTSFDLRCAHRHPGRWDRCRCGRNCFGGRVVRPGSGVEVPAAGSAKRTPPRRAHCADSRDRRRDRLGRPSPHTGQAVILAQRWTERPVRAPGVRRFGQIGHFDANSGRSSIAWVRSASVWGICPFRRALRRSSIAAPESVTRCHGLPSPNHDRRAAPCPAPLGADRAVPGDGGRRRPVGRRRMQWQRRQ